MSTLTAIIHIGCRGSIPPEIGRLTKLSRLVLNDNQLTPSARAYADSRIKLYVNDPHSTRAGWIS
eukprot:scaffold202327_cov30-Prasinocladus_malaysianus.AAC.1